MSSEYTASQPLCFAAARYQAVPVGEGESLPVLHRKVEYDRGQGLDMVPPELSYESQSLEVGEGTWSRNTGRLGIEFAQYLYRYNQILRSFRK